MTELLRQLVAGPRARHAEAKLDLCYVTEDIIVTSGPAVTYPSRAYRNPLPRLTAFLHSRHKDAWRIFEFRAEGTGYADKDVQGRISHFPWPDHHPPPFAVLPRLMAGMQEWLGETAVERGDEARHKSVAGLADSKGSEDKGDKEDPKRVAILHCKAGKGRSGTVACSYLISVRGWSVEEALTRFTERRMRPNWGDGVSIKSQRRWIGYLDRWAKNDKKYAEMKVKIVEVRIWGRREGTRVLVRGFIQEGKKIKVLHTWKDSDCDDIKIGDEIKPSESDPSLVRDSGSLSSGAKDSSKSSPLPNRDEDSGNIPSGPGTPQSESSFKLPTTIANPNPLTLCILQPVEPLILPTPDINIEVERRNRTSYGIPSVVTSTAHSWFNAYFEGRGPERNGDPERTGIYSVEWDAMDGLKGSSRRGVRAVEKISVVWELLEEEDARKEEKVVQGIHKEKDEAQKEPMPGSTQGQDDVKNDEIVKPGTDSSNNIVEGDPKLPSAESDVEEGLQSYGIKGEQV
ncbi:phosphatases II [Microthyrium microscopicum]|uniref:phosphatidylinositol-3,4,5-trisphosphate 3-phosphatase n=1 Tax=Microthyrium microscopicum TaxID=703497 RepID=A0A6A6U3C4_9PEZI|nr:phosphatases II [Microthyrium microscopicum]